MNIEDIINVLKKNDYKITPQRKAIIQALIENDTSLISIEALFARANQLYSKTNISTIYRNLEILEKLNLVYKVMDEATSLYKLICNHYGHHHHLICKNCGKTEAIDFCPIETLQQLSKEKEFNLEDHKLELYGTCKKCQLNDSETSVER